MQGSCVPSQMDFAGPSWSTVHPRLWGSRPQEASLPDHVLLDEVWLAGGTGGKAGERGEAGWCWRSCQQTAGVVCAQKYSLGRPEGAVLGTVLLAELAGGGRRVLWVTVQFLFPVPQLMREPTCVQTLCAKQEVSAECLLSFGEALGFGACPGEYDCRHTPGTGALLGFLGQPFMHAAMPGAAGTELVPPTGSSGGWRQAPTIFPSLGCLYCHERDWALGPKSLPSESSHLAGLGDPDILFSPPPQPQVHLDSLSLSPSPRSPPSHGHPCHHPAGRGPLFPPGTLMGSI